MRKLLILLLTLAFTSATFADKVTEEQALKKAQKFFKDKRLESKNLRRLKKSVQQQNATQEDFYVFNAENKGGFVIISGDDRTPEVLGYSEKGYLNADSMPAHMKAWLEGYAKQIAQIQKTGQMASPRKAPSNHAAIQPFLTTAWGQDYPYNMNCPDYFTSGNKCPTGCVATAMAQVMYYHRNKSTNKTRAKIPGYLGNYDSFYNSQLTINEVSDGTFIDWDNMLDNYNGSETDIQKEAVANLMLYCGTAVKMEYSIFGSGAYSFDVPVALKSYFDYSEHTTLVWRQNYTEDSWDDLIYSELDKGNPILYSGSNGSAGHAFVCDGYDGNGYYHINWGWEGLSDSYFLLSALNPETQGTGGSSEGYNDGQCALIGAVPNGEITRLTSQSVSLTGTTSFSLSGMGDNITVPIRWNVKNLTDTSHSFDHAIGLYQNGVFIKVLEETGISVDFAVDEVVIVDASLNIESNLAPGVYQLYAVSRSSGEDNWFRNDNSSECYITLVVKDDFMSFYVGKPAATENVINFADDEVKRICVENWDTDGDGEISYNEAAAVTDFGYVFDRSIIKTFDEAQYFTGITSFGLTFYEGYACKSLTSIKIPSSAVSIKEGAFFGCDALTSIEVPASVKEIGRGAFYCCFSLQDVVLHEGLEIINDEAFYKCPISSINIPASVSSLSGIIWYGCESLNDFYVDENSSYYCSVDGVIFSKDLKKLIYFPCKRDGSYSIPEGTEVISSNAFTSSKIETIEIPASVTCIQSFGLNSMFNLHEVTIPSTVTTIETGVLYGCVSLEQVIMPGSRSIIPDGMFMHCWSLKNFELPDGLTSIGPNAFRCCSSLKVITIPSTVVSIDDYAFADSGLRKVKSLIKDPCAINSTVFENINSNAVLYVSEESLSAYKEADNWKDFSKIVSLGEKVNEPYAELNNGVLSFFYDTNREERDGETYDNIEWYEKNSTITKVIFDPSFANFKPNSTVQWFEGCDKLTEIQGIENLNTSEVTDMNLMFHNCSSLNSIDISDFNTNNVTNMWAMFSGCSSLVSIDISSFNTEKVTNMDGMFVDCSNLKTVVLPNDLKFIDSYQFAYCSSLDEISIPESVTSIRDQAFAGGCYSLKEITIPSKVTFIGDNAFSYSGLTKVTSLMQTPCTITSTVFENVSSNATLCVPSGCKAAYEAADNWKDFKIIMGPSSNLVYMVDGEEYCSYVIEIGTGVTAETPPTKEGYTFSGWSEIPEVMPDHDVTVIGSFTPINYTITYDLAGGELDEGITNPTTFTIESEEFMLFNPFRTGYNFEGWTGTGLIEATTTVTVNHGSTGDREYTANWSVRQHEFDFANSQEWATWCSDWAWTKPDGITAYTISGVSGTTVNIAEVEGGIIPAYTPLLLMKVGDDVTASFSSAGTGTNNLVSVLATGCTIWGNATDDIMTKGDYYIAGNTYVLYNGSFILANKDTGIPGNRCVLTLDSNDRADARQLYLSVDNTTGIVSIENDLNGQWYTIDGRKLGIKPSNKGVYINNGRKVMIK